MSKAGKAAAGVGEPAKAKRQAWNDHRRVRLRAGGLALAAALVLCACAPAVTPAQPGTNKVLIRQEQVTLPPPWTPTPTSTPARRATAEPPPIAAISPAGPWILYCDVNEEAALMDPAGPGRLGLHIPCLSPARVSGAAGLALADGSVIQFPSGEPIREACCDFAGWSVNGELALLSAEGEEGEGNRLAVYDVAADRVRPIAQSDLGLTPLGLSPQGIWAVYLEGYRDIQDAESDEPAKLMAVMTTGQGRRRLLEVSDRDVFYGRSLGWLSESSLLFTRSDHPCNLVPRNHDLRLVDVQTGVVRQLFGLHSYAAFDPQSQTVLLAALPPGACLDGGGQSGELVLLSARDGWTPHRLALPREWGEAPNVSLIEWHLEIEKFSVRVGGNVTGGAPLRLFTLSPRGAFGLDFLLSGAEFIEGARLHPSPDGWLILIGAAAPFGTRLYDAEGRLVRILSQPDRPLNYGVHNVLWLPDQEAVLMTEAEGLGIFAAAETNGWAVETIEPDATYRSNLTLVGPPERPFHPICAGSGMSRLQEGDRVMVSLEPPLASWMRVSAGDLEMIGLQPGEKATIVGGPRCEAGYVWWDLAPDSTEVTGWVAEGDAEGAWLLPIEGRP